MTWSATDGGTYLRWWFNFSIFWWHTLTKFWCCEITYYIMPCEKTKDEIYRSRKQKLF